MNIFNNEFAVEGLAVVLSISISYNVRAWEIEFDFKVI